MSHIHISLFGKVSIVQDGRPVSALSAKALELLCYLVLFRDRPHGREALSDELWPGARESLSKKYLRQTLWQLRTTLKQAGKADGGAESIVAAAFGWVGINREADWWLDVDEFERAYDPFRDVAGEELTDRQARTLDEASALYCGNLLESWYQDWCALERDRLQLVHLSVLEKLMGYCEANRLFAEGLAYGHRSLRHDSAREATHRRLMRLYFRAGERCNALRQYDRCVAALATQFGLGPSQETVALHEQLRAGRLEAAAVPVPRWQGAAAEIRMTAVQVLPDVQHRLDDLRKGMAALQQQVDELTALCGLALSDVDAYRDGRRDGALYTGS